MSSDRDKLIAEAKLMCAELIAPVDIDTRDGQLAWLIDRLVAELVRDTLREVSTVAELDALPEGTVIRHAPENAERIEFGKGIWQQGGIAEMRLDGAGQRAWFLIGQELGWRSHQVGLLPATVLFTPTSKDDE